MAERADRVYKRKRLKDPQNPGTYWIDIPVISQATFKTMADQAQEHIVYFNNSADANGRLADRVIRVQSVENPNEVGMSINVERIQQISIKIMQEAAQEYVWHLANNDPPPRTSESDTPSHEEKHFVRYVGNDPDAWVDIELIDVLKINSATEQYQDYFLYLRHPDLGISVNDLTDPFTPLTLSTCDPSLELIDPVDGIDPPYRLDMFQNIVNIHWPEPTDGSSRGWFTAFPVGYRFVCTSAQASTAFISGSFCLVTDMSALTPGFGNNSPTIRPTYTLCDWPITEPDVPISYVSYSAGTLYKKISDAELAFEHSRSGSWCEWNWREVVGDVPPGPDESPEEGALCPELNDAGDAFETYRDFMIQNGHSPVYHPNYRVFIVDDANYETWMDGIHDFQDRPDIGEFP